MTIKSIRIGLVGHRLTSTGKTREEDGPSNRRTPRSGAKTTTEALGSRQRNEKGRNTEQHREDKRSVGNGEQGTSSPIPPTSQITYHPLMHGPSHTDRQRYTIHRYTSSIADRPTTISGVDSTGMPCLPRTSSSPATMESAAILSETLWTTPPAPIPTTTTSTDTSWACVIRRAHEELSSTSVARTSSSEVPPAEQDASRHLTEEEPQTQQPLRHDETAVIVRLPQRPSYIKPCAGPVTCTCCSTPHPANIILHAPCDLSLPWINQLTFHFANVG